MSKISVIMGVYNEEASIAKAIDSVIKQTYSCWEFIIVDDCSTDKTRDIISKYCASEPRIKLYKNKKNFGLAFSLNLAINKSSGAYIARMDADDISLPNRFEQQLKILDLNSKVMVVGTAAYYIDSDSLKKRLVRMPQYHQDLSNFIFKKSPFIHPSVMMRKEYLKITNGYDSRLRRAQDYDLWLRGRFIGEYYNIQEPLIIYAYQNNKISKSFFNSVQIRLKNSSSVMDFFKSIYWSIYEAVYISLIVFTKVLRPKKVNHE